MISLDPPSAIAIFAAMMAAIFGACVLGVRLGGRSARQIQLREDEAPAAATDSGTGQKQLADDLDAAIVRGQLFLVHQPKMRARTGTIEAIETLVRWRHPEHGLVSPSDFIGVAEQRGEIRRITEWVLRQTINEQRSLSACGHPLPFNINVSAYLLADRDFAQWMLDTIRTASAPIGIEITETAMIADPAGALRNLHLFADAGVHVAIDDYGAGLSSLAYLKQLPARELKIDRMFISGLSTSHRDPLLVRSTIDLAHALEMEVTAEGVDSASTMALLRVMGCDLMQGYLIAKPMPLGELRAFLDTRDAAGEPAMPVAFPWAKSAAGVSGMETQAEEGTAKRQA
ncbi:EAL domain-containing protein [Sphingomonas sp.]|uniref:EAL domain-containing protein n=1 Tax=Sphingomonas sp. TaxID=28214 RepID=UPI0025F3A6D5|nr:EAL domain-containing protein [Sphingomonas sp.]